SPGGEKFQAPQAFVPATLQYRAHPSAKAPFPSLCSQRLKDAETARAPDELTRRLALALRVDSLAERPALQFPSSLRQALANPRAHSSACSCPRRSRR